MSRENVELVERLLDAQRRGDVLSAIELLDPDVEWVAHRSATEGAFRGHAGFQRFVADTDESFETFEPHFELRDVGDQVLAWGTITVRGRGSGVTMDIPVGGLFGLRDGKITSWRDYGSKEKAFEAVGLSV